MEDPIEVLIYVLSNQKNAYKYVGITKNLKERLHQHNSGASRYTKAFIPWKVIYLEKAQNYAIARQREKYLKSAAGKRFLATQINSNE